MNAHGMENLSMGKRAKLKLISCESSPERNSPSGEMENKCSSELPQALPLGR